MLLAMSRPWKHPNSGVYWLRRGVPEDLRALVGKREEKRSLQAHCTSLTLAEWLCRTADRIDPA
jgi:hypothetical protein